MKKSIISILLIAKIILSATVQASYEPLSPSLASLPLVLAVYYSTPHSSIKSLPVTCPQPSKKARTDSSVSVKKPAQKSGFLLCTNITANEGVSGAGSPGDDEDEQDPYKRKLPASKLIITESNQLKCVTCGDPINPCNGFKTPCCQKPLCKECAPRLQQVPTCLCERQLQLLYLCGLCTQGNTINNIGDLYIHMGDHVESNRHYRIIYLNKTAKPQLNTFQADEKQVESQLIRSMAIQCPFPDCGQNPLLLGELEPHIQSSHKQEKCPLDSCKKNATHRHLAADHIYRGHIPCQLSVSDGIRLYPLEGAYTETLANALNYAVEVCTSCQEEIGTYSDSMAEAHFQQVHASIICPVAVCSMAFPVGEPEMAEQHLTEQHPAVLPMNFNPPAENTTSTAEDVCSTEPLPASELQQELTSESDQEAEADDLWLACFTPLPPEAQENNENDSEASSTQCQYCQKAIPGGAVDYAIHIMECPNSNSLLQ